MAIRATRFVLAALWVVAPCGAHADDYPSRPLRVIVPYAAGGPSDTAARLVAEPLSRQLGQPVRVENRGGAGGLTGTELYLHEPPDGYAVLLGAIGPLTIIPAGKSVSYDPEKDFVALGCIWFSAQALVVNARLPLTSLRDFLAYAKASPGKATIGSAGVGTVSHLTIELFRREAAIDIVHIPSRSTGAGLPDVLGGQIDGLVGDAAVLAPQVASSTLRALAVASSQRAPALPDVPTMSEAGLPGVIAESWFGLVVSAGTPATIVARLRSALVSAQNDPAYVEALAKQKASAGQIGPERFAELIHRDAGKWRAVVQAANIKFE